MLFHDVHHMIRPHVVLLTLLGFGCTRSRDPRCFNSYGLYQAAVMLLCFYLTALSTYRAMGARSMDAESISLVTGAIFWWMCVYLGLHSIRSIRGGVFVRMTHLWESTVAHLFLCDSHLLPDIIKWGTFAWAILNGVSNAIAMFLRHYSVRPERGPEFDDFGFVGSRYVYVLTPLWYFGLFSLATGVYFTMSIMLSVAWKGFRLSLLERFDERRRVEDFAAFHAAAIRGYRPLTALTRDFDALMSVHVAVMLGGSIPILILVFYVSAIRSSTDAFDRAQIGWWCFIAFLQLLMLLSAAFINNQSEKFREAYTEVFLSQLGGAVELGRNGALPRAEGEGEESRLLPPSHQPDPVLMERARGFMEVLHTNAWTNAVYAWEFFPINMSMVITLASIFTTYLLVLLQFAQAEESVCARLLARLPPNSSLAQLADLPS